MNGLRLKFHDIDTGAYLNSVCVIGVTSLTDAINRLAGQDVINPSTPTPDGFVVASTSITRKIV